MRNIAAAIVAAAALVGCATPSSREYWYRPVTPDAEVARDQADCRLRARESTVAIRGGIEAGIRQAELDRACMEARGYILLRR